MFRGFHILKKINKDEYGMFYDYFVHKQYVLLMFIYNDILPVYHTKNIERETHSIEIRYVSMAFQTGQNYVDKNTIT